VKRIAADATGIPINAPADIAGYQTRIA